MKKLFIALILAWSVVYILDSAWLHNFHLHMDFTDNNLNMVEWLVGGLAMAFVFIILAAVFATGILALFLVVAIAAVFAMVVAGFSALWPIVIGVAVYYVCRDKPSHTQLS